jgi:hypothetical protein
MDMPISLQTAVGKTLEHGKTETECILISKSYFAFEAKNQMVQL